MAVSASLKTETVEETTELISGEELYQMPGTDLTELVKGEIVKMSPTGFWHGVIEGKFYRALEFFVEENKLGLVMVGEVGLYTRRNPDTVRGADVIFISHQRLAQVKSQSYLDVAPELIVEIMSPNDAWSEVMAKLEEYFNIGVLTVWVADPDKQQVYAYHALTDVQRYTLEDTLSGGKALPNFSIPVTELFATN